VWAITRRELLSSFSSPVFYIIAAVALCLYGFFFTMIATGSGEAHLRYLFHNMYVTLLFMCPLLTMRLFAEEKKMGTFELLMTSPVTLFELVLGKLLGVALTFGVILLITLEFPAFLIAYGKPDPGPLATGYLGIALMSLSFLSIGLFTSSLTDNQIVAAVLSFGLLLFLAIINWASSQAGGALGDFLQGLSVFERFESFAKVVLDSGDVLFFLSLTGVFMFLTVRSLDWKRW
jgi:ABC-2 type transport system permease protein